MEMICRKDRLVQLHIERGMKVTDMTYNEMLEYIDEIPKFTKKNSLEHTRRLLHLLGDPHKSYPVIHVAGSNGKGSVCSFLTSGLMQAGRKTGTFISPHLVCLEERFAINGKPCERTELEAAFRKVMEVVKQTLQRDEPHPSYFELLFLIGMVIFQRAGVDIAILETGLGGRLDATNSIEEPILTVLTSISLEHTEILGDTITQIAAEKAGILKPNVPVVFDANDIEAAKVIGERAKELKCPAYPMQKENYQIQQITTKKIAFSYRSGYDSIGLEIPFVAEYQVMNACVAVRAMRLLQDWGYLKEQDLQRGLQKAVWPGRMEQVRENIFLDGAHNVAGIERLLETVKRIAKKPPILLFSMVKEKHHEEAILRLTEQVEWDKIYVSTIEGPRGIPAQKLAEEFLKEKEQVICIDENQRAFEEARKSRAEDQLLICTGSLYFIGNLKKILEEEEHDQF